MTCLLPQQSPLFISLRRHKPLAQPHISVSGTHWKEQRRLSALVCVSSSSSVTENVEDSPPLPSSLVDDGDFDSDQVLLSSSGCKACGREEIERGCNGEGRIQGGIATVPGFGWWPIKAYRPCPGFLASGGNYRRRGQSMDEVAFGGGKRRTSMDDLDELEKRNKGTDRRKFKR